MTTRHEAPVDAPLPVAPPHPVRVRGQRDPVTTRWIWLVKWVLTIPHWIVLAVLWVALAPVLLVALVAILVTGRYPRPLFDYTVGVLRWTWRVAFYTNAAFGTDRYPPFTLRADDSYPADLDVVYPERLSRGLVLVKWWLLALPQYVVVGLLVGGPWWVWRDQDYGWTWGASGLVALLALAGIVVYAVSGSYPRGLFGLIVGLDRWVLRVAAYATLLTDRYPPFRLDMGEDEPTPAPHLSSPEATRVSSPRSGWGGGEVAALVVGAVLCLVALAPLVGGITGTVADRAGRDSDGMLAGPPMTVATSGYALRSPDVLFEAPPTPTSLSPTAALGTVRLRVEPTDPTRPLFVGIAPRAAADRYLAGVATGTLLVEGRDSSGAQVVREQTGGALTRAPGTAPIWVAGSEGTGVRTITWTPVPGDWTVVVLDPTLRPGLDVSVDAGASLPGLGELSLWLLVAGVVLAVMGAGLVIAAVTVVHRQRGRLLTEAP